MKNSQTLRRALLISTLLVLSVVIAASVYTQASKSQKKPTDHRHTYEAAKVKSAPEVRSAIRDLEISSVTLINEGTPQAAVVINVINNRDAAVMALDFIAGKDDYSALGFDGLLLEDGPVVIIAPHTLKTFTWFLGEIREGEAIVLASAIFADGKEEGEKRSLDGMKIHRRHFQQNQRDAKAKKGGQ